MRARPGSSGGAPASRIEWVEADEAGATALGLADLRGPDGQRWWGVNWALLRAPTEAALRAHYLARRGAPKGEVVFYRAWMSLDGDGQVHRELLPPTP